MRMRWGAYAGVSTALAGGVIFKALAQRPNFYSASVYLSQSNANLMILANFTFVASCTLLFSLQKLLYGPLRPIEIEQLYEKAWFAVTETCLAMTIFRGEIGAWFLVMFFALLTGKVWGWIAEGRVEILEQQPPQNPRLFHTRLAASLALSVLFDTWMLEYVVKQVLDMARPDMMVMFGFEFAVLSVMSLSTMARYGISLVEILIVRGQKFRRAEEIRKERRDAREAEQRAAAEERSTTHQLTAGDQNTTPTPTTALALVDEPVDDNEIEVEGWEEKGRWIFYLDLMTDFLKLVIYLSFFFILLIFYGIPIHIMRDVFLTCRSFFKRIGDFIRYRTATRDMNERYPDATAEEIGREDVCIICREEMKVMPRPEATTNDADPAAPQPPRATNPVAERMRPKKLPCGHVLHFSCLRSWLERQQICPTCRREVVPRTRDPAPGAGVAGGFAQGFADGVNAARGQNAPNQAPPQHGPAQTQANDPHVEPQNQNRGRVFQLGPLRIAVGAGRGMMMEDLAQRIQDGDGRAPDPAANAQNGPPQYGFGFGFGRSNRRVVSHRANLQDRIDSVERQIRREIESLSLSANELSVLRLLQAELTRLRMQRGQHTTTVASPASQRGVTAEEMPTTLPQAPLQPQTTTATGFVADSRQNVLQAGSDGLPQGLTLPEGWTMMPLQRMQPGAQIPAMGQAFPQPGPIPIGGGGIPIGPSLEETIRRIQQSALSPDAPMQIQLQARAELVGHLQQQQQQQLQQLQHHHLHHNQHQQAHQGPHGLSNQHPNAGNHHHHHSPNHVNIIPAPEQQQQQPTNGTSAAASEGLNGIHAHTLAPGAVPIANTIPVPPVNLPGLFEPGRPLQSGISGLNSEPRSRSNLEERERFVRELVNRRQTDGESAETHPNGTGDVTEAPRTTGHTEEATTAAAPAMTTTPLPAWGSAGTANGDMATSASGGPEEAAPTANGVSGNTSTAQEEEPSTRKPKSATVEDLVEDAD